MRSKTFNVKSNAARAAQRYGLTRADLIPVSGGWCFNAPNDAAPQTPVEPRTEGVDEHGTTAAEILTNRPDEPAWQPDEPIEWAASNELVVNGELPKDEPAETVAEPAPSLSAAGLVPGETYIATVEHNGVVSSVEPVEPVAAPPAKPAKAKRERKAKVAARQQPEKSPSDDKSEAPSDTKSKAHNNAPKAGKGAELLALIKTDWQPVPELLKLTGWLPHTMRGYIYRVAKAERWTVERKRDDGVSYYRITV
jgi:hypothetical protein